MIINLITLNTVKSQLGLSASTYDAAITAMIPIVSNDIRRILNQNYDTRYVARFDSTGATIDFGISIGGFYNPPYDTGSNSIFALGQVVYSPYIAEDTYLTAFNPDTGLFTLSNTPTDQGTWIYPTLQISQWPAVSKMIWYKTTVNNVKAAVSQKRQSMTIGPLSKTYAQSEINSKYDYPQSLIDDLGTPNVRIG